MRGIDRLRSQLSRTDSLYFSRQTEEEAGKAAEEAASCASLRRLVDSNRFSLATSALVACGSVVLALEADDDAAHARQGDAPQQSLWTRVGAALTLCFVVEIVLRIAAKKLGFFKAKWDSFEFVLCVLAAGDLVIMLLGLEEDAPSSMGALPPLLRTLRLLRLARVLRLLRAGREMQMLFEGILNSLRLLFWSVVLLVILNFVAAIFCTREIGTYWVRHQIEDGSSESIARMFGSVPDSMFTLFQVMTGDSWASAIARPLIRERPELMLFFVAYVLFMLICVTNVIMAIIVESVMKDTLLENETHKAQQLDMLRESHKQALLQLFYKAVGTEGTLTRTQWRTVVHSPEATSLLNAMGLPADAAHDLFDVLDVDGNGTLSLDEFLPALLRGVHEVRHADILAVQIDLWRSHEHIDARVKNMHEAIAEEFTDQYEDLAKQIADLRLGSQSPSTLGPTPVEPRPAPPQPSQGPPHQVSFHGPAGPALLCPPSHQSAKTHLGRLAV